MMDMMFCRASVGKNGSVEFESNIGRAVTIEQQIKEDKAYGKLTPRNGKYFTFKVFAEDKEIKHKTIVKAFMFGFRRWLTYTNAPPVKVAKEDEEPDFKIYFRTPQTDPNLLESTLMYMYYPINDVNRGERGVCVVNSRYFWTVHGESLPMWIIDPDHYKEGSTTAKGSTFDIDAIFTHELGHGLLGLPHSPNRDNVMSSNSRIMAEYPTDEDVARAQAKWGKANRTAREIKRWLEWLFTRSERY